MTGTKKSTGAKKAEKGTVEPGEHIKVCATHPDTELVCPKCQAARGGATTVAKHGNEQMRDWGKLGGRPKKKVKV